MSVANDAQWQQFCERTGVEAAPQFATNEDRMANMDMLTQAIESKFADMIAKEVEACLEGTDVAASAVMGIMESLTDPHLLEWEMVIEVNDPKIGPMDDVTVLGLEKCIKISP